MGKKILKVMVNRGAVPETGHSFLIGGSGGMPPPPPRDLNFKPSESGSVQVDRTLSHKMIKRRVSLT